MDRSPEGSPHGSTARPNGAVRVWACGGAAVLGLILSVGWARTTEPAKSAAHEQAFWRVGKPVPIAVRQGRATFRAPAASPGSELLVVVSATSRETGPFSIKLAARPARSAAIPAIADDGVPACGKTCLREQRPREATERARAHVDPPRERTFHMLVRDGDVYSPSNYIAVPAVLRGVGDRIQVYVAREDLAAVSARGDRRRRQYVRQSDLPLMSRRFGPAPDVDGDGRFTVVLSSWLDHLGGGRYAVDGFVRVADLDRAFRHRWVINVM